MKQMPIDWDVGWVGSCFHLKEPEVPNVNIYRSRRGSRCGHAYCLSKAFAQKMIHDIRNVDKPADFYYNYIIKKFDLNNNAHPDTPSQARSLASNHLRLN